MKSLRLALIGTLVAGLSTISTAFAQSPAYQTSFITSITYQNVGTAPTTVEFKFFPQGSSSPTVVSRNVNAGAGSALFVGGNDVGLVSGFLGSAVMSSAQPVVATLVQVPQSSTVKNRPLSNGFSSASSKVLMATVLKNKFGVTSKFSIQNAHSKAIDITVKFFDADNPGNAPIVVTETNIPVGSAKYFDMGTVSAISASAFNGSATVDAVESGTSTAANIVGSAMELSVSGTSAVAFEGVTGGNNPLYVATGLCNVFGGASTSYAVQNVGSADATVTVSYKGVIEPAKTPKSVDYSQTIKPGNKFGFIACNADTGKMDGFNGAASITSNQPIVVIAKVFGAGLGTAWLGEAQGTAKLAMPYVRYSPDTEYNAGKYQRTFLAVQNIGSTTVNNVKVEYRDKDGNLVGTHTIASIEPGAKAPSNPTSATGDTAKLQYFGNPEANTGGGFGGGAIIIGPSGSQLIAISRVQSIVNGARVAEDYNGIAIQ